MVDRIALARSTLIWAAPLNQGRYRARLFPRFADHTDRGRGDKCGFGVKYILRRDTASVMQRSVTRRAPGISPSFIPSHRVAIDLRSGIGSSETGLSLSPRLLLMTIVTLVHGPAGAGVGCRSATGPVVTLMAAQCNSPSRNATRDPNG